MQAGRVGTGPGKVDNLSLRGRARIEDSRRQHPTEKAPVATFPTPISAKSSVLHKRHITHEQSLILDLKTVSSEESIDYLGYKPKGSVAFVETMPYWDMYGHPLGDPQFYRCRINYTPGWEPPEGDWKDYPKYRSPRKKGELVYLPRGLGMDWVGIFGEPSVPIVITEGEYKSIRVCTAWDTPCIGLGGVWMFHASKMGWPEGMDMTFAGREFYVTYDADPESTHEHPLKGGAKGPDGAAKRLANKLYQEGAVPWLLYIARTETFIKARASDINVKMGVDDFIDAGGTWGELLATRENPIEHAGLAYLMDRYAYYRGSPSGVVNVANGLIYRVRDWMDVEANCIGTSMVEKGGKLVPLKIRFPMLYMEHAERPGFDNWIFEPGADSGLDQERGTFNRWRGMAIEGNIGPGEQERYQEIVAMWRRFIERLCGAESWEYFEKWVADLFQNPGRKTTIAMLLRSSLTGVGKSLLGEILRDIVGPRHSVKVSLEHAMGHFNSLMGDKVLVQIDEANDVRKEYESKMLDMITSEETEVTLKGRDTVVVKNYARLFLSSNGVAPLVLNEHNRRVYVMEPTLSVDDAKGEWGIWVGEVVAKVLRSHEGLRMLRQHFNALDIADWVPTSRVPQTAAMMDVVEASSSKNNELVEALWRAFLDDEAGIWVATPRLRASPEGKVLWSRFKDKLKTTGGQFLTHVTKLPGETGAKRVWVFVRSGVRRLPQKHVVDQGWAIDTDAMDATRLKELMVSGTGKAEKSYAEWSGILPSSKF